jgi:carbon-monoxide dehydrogenase large subunit
VTSGPLTLGQVPRGKWIGASVTRVEDARVLLGEARYVADLALPGMLHVTFVRSMHAHARIVSVDAAAALAIDGVLGVHTAADLPTGDLVDGMANPDLPKTPQPALVRDRAMWVGDTLAAVVGSSAHVAEDGARAVRVEYEVLPAVVDVDVALTPEAPVLHEQLGSNLLYREHKAFGDVEGAFAAADRVFHRRTHINRISASPMETRGCLATFERSSGQLTVWSSSQSPGLLRTTLAQLLEHPHHLVRVIAPDVGGGFGPKMSTYPEELVVAALARKLARPVRWIEDRRELLMAMNHAKEQIVDLEIAARADGRILAMRTRTVGDAGAYSFNSATALIEPALTANLMPGVYDVQTYEYELKAVLTNKTPIGPYRGVGWTSGHTARELLLDEMAVELGIDPGALRRMNMIQPDQLPYRSVTGCEYDSGSYVESLDEALDAIGYDEVRRAQAAAAPDAAVRVGIGISPYVEPTGFGTEIGRQTGYPYPSHDNASVTVDPGGKVRLAVGINSQGQGHATTFAQVAADVLGVRPEDVDVVAGDTDRTPFGMGAWGSRGAVIGAGIVSIAAQKVRAKILRLASDMLECAAEDLVVEDSTITVAGTRASLTMEEVALAAYFEPDLRRDGEDPFLSATGFYDPRATYSNGCFAAVVEVDLDTGIVAVRRMLSVEDCGTVLNPMIVEGQVRGGAVQGIGAALLEDLVYDDQGQLITTTFMDYLLPLASDTPSIEVHHLESPSPVTMGGVKGMGESALLASPAAVINAVLDAIGPHDPTAVLLPLTPERVLRLAGRLPERNKT